MCFFDVFFFLNVFFKHLTKSLKNIETSWKTQQIIKQHKKHHKKQFIKKIIKKHKKQSYKHKNS